MMSVVEDFEALVEQTRRHVRFTKAIKELVTWYLYAYAAGQIEAEYGVKVSQLYLNDDAKDADISCQPPLEMTRTEKYWELVRYMAGHIPAYNNWTSTMDRPSDEAFEQVIDEWRQGEG